MHPDLEQPTLSEQEHAEKEGQKALKSLRLSRAVIPILLGLAAVGYLFYQQFDIEQFRSIRWSKHAFFWIGVSFLLLLVRHVFYAFRLRAITRNFFSWKKCLELIVIWEFSGALTPTSKGGPLVMLFALSQEKLAPGRTAAAIFYTIVCDAGFFVFTLPVFLLIFGPRMLYPGMDSFRDVGLASGTFFFTYALIIVYWTTLVFFLIVRPDYARNALEWVSRRRWLRRWSDKINRMGREFGNAAMEIRRQGFRYHFHVILGTVGAWTSKFLMINCLIIAIVPDTPIDGSTQMFIYARLVAMFIIMTFSPTPGGAGLAEVALVNFISDYVPKGIGMVVALLWRGMAYYGYLLVGAVVVPNWIAKQLAHRKHPEKAIEPASDDPG